MRGIPQRTCVVCGSKRAKSELLRLVVDIAGRVYPDRHQRRQGRGAYVCRSADCQVRLKRIRLQKAFRRSLADSALEMIEALQVEDVERPLTTNEKTEQGGSGRLHG